MKFIFLFVSLVLITNIYSQDKKTMEDVQSLIKEVRQRYAPDSRTARFIINAKAQKGSVFLEGETTIPAAKTELMKKMAEKKIKCDDLIETLPAKELGENIYGVINLSVANLRTEPRNGGEMANQAFLGFPGQKFKKSRDNWDLI
jgi:gamma-D-glutamyl-L-lysine dipeptidyl-peptidase